MATLSQLQSTRATAGATYASALASFKAAYVALAAADRALASRLFASPVPTFRLDHPEMSELTKMLAHPTYQPTVTNDWYDQVKAAADTHVNAFTPG